MKKILELIKPYRKKLILVLIIQAFGMITALLMPYLMSEIVEKGISEGNITLVWQYAALMLILAVLSFCSSLASTRINTRITSGYTSDLMHETFVKINSLSYSDYSKIGASGLLARATDDIWNVEGAVISLPNTLVTVPIMFIGSSVLSFMADSSLSAVFMLSIPPVLILVLILMRPLYGMWDKSDKYVDIQNKIVRERLMGLRVVRAFNNEGREHARAKRATEEMSKYMIRANTRGGMVDPFAMLLLNLATVAVVYLGGIRAQSGSGPSAGDVIAVLQYIAMISNALINVSWTLAWLPRLKVAVKRINEVHSLPGEELALVDGDQKHDGGFSLKIDNVSFTYPDSKEPVIQGASISVREGESIAIIGGTGSGKTTLLRLLLGLFDPTDGSISIGGTDYKELKRSEIRSHFSVALQKAMIFEGSIRNNMKMGNPDATDEEICEALRLSKMSEFLDSHPEGLDYLLVGMGQNVSGGQRQRLSMARTVIRRADIYVFDDSFSALDFLTESEIRENFSTALDGKSRIFITQRVSTAMSAGRIYVMDGGKITASGTHGELLSSSDIYREIAVSQLGGAVVGGAENEEK